MNVLVGPERNAVQSTTWHARSRDDVERILQTGPNGLSQVEATSRLARYGPNQLEEVPMPSMLTLVLRQLRSPLIYLLIIAAVVSLALNEMIDAGVIGLVILLDAIIGFTQERKAEISVRSLAHLVAPRARVIRDARDSELESRDLVPGDLVLLESGVRVPADIRLISTTSLMVDESMLTGESVPVVKGSDPLDAALTLADRRNMVFAGTTVTSGRGRGYVVATGTKSELGAIATEVQSEDSTQTLLQQRLGHLGRIISAVVVIAAVAVLGTGIIMGYDIAEMLIVAVAAAVSAVPEGLPVAFTITLAVGVRRMARRNAIIRQLPAVETLGSTSVIGSDKTGTLTENRMTVESIWSVGRTLTLPRHSGMASDVEISEEVDDRALNLTLLTGILTNEAELYVTEDGYDTKGDPTEAALLIAAARTGIEPRAVRDAYPVVAEIPFEPERQYSGAIRQHDARVMIFVKGAPERVLAMCEFLETDNGPVEIDRDLVHQAAGRFAARGLRVLAMAYGELAGPADDCDLVEEPARLTFLGLQGMLDPPRAEVREAIAGCQQAGIRVVMITGDHAETARAIARDLGIAGTDAPVLTGVDLERMSKEELRAEVRDVSIYARVTPEHKLRVVRALQSHNEVVAVTGDGVNDAPALRAADIGIAMGKSGTDVAREASDMVLTDDNFVSIYAAVEEGRVVFDNIRKVTFFLISTGVAEIITIMSALVLGWPVPFLAAQIIWLNLVTNGLQDVALAFEPGERGILQQPPRRRDEPIVSRLLWERALISGLVMAIGTLFLFNFARVQSDSLVQAQSVALTTMVLFQAFHVGNSRSETRSLFRTSPISNPFLFIATLAAFAVHVSALYLPPTQVILRVEPIEFQTWPMMIAVAATILFVVEAHKLVRRKRAGTSRAAQRSAMTHSPVDTH